MIFLRYESFRQYIRLYPITTLILLIHVVLFAAMEVVGSSTDEVTLLHFGAMFGGIAEQPEWWRYFNAVILHIGFSHLLFNSFAVLIFAPPLEKMLGSFTYLLFYVCCGVMGNVASYYLHMKPFIGAGASGAIYGIYGAFLFFGLFRKDQMDQQAKKTVITILIVGAIYSVIVPYIDLYAHAGGFVTGFILAAILSLRIARKPFY